MAKPAFKRYVIVQEGRYAKSLGIGERLPVPACSTPEEAAEWAVNAKRATESKLDAGFCSDCTPEYQATMITQGRCENPNVRFVNSRKFGVVGVIRG